MPVKVRNASRERAVQREPDVLVERLDVEAVLAVQPVADEQRDRREEPDREHRQHHVERVPPPGSTTKTSATSATMANFQANCMAAKAIYSIAPAPTSASTSAPRRHPVDHEHDRRVAREEAQQERDRGVADHEGQHGRHDQRAQPHVLLVGPVEDRRELEQRRSARPPGPTAGTRSAPRSAVEAEEQAGGDRRARARDARHQRERLREPDRDPVAGRDALDGAVVRRRPARRRAAAGRARSARCRSGRGRAPRSRSGPGRAARRSRSGSCRGRCTSRAGRRARGAHPRSRTRAQPGPRDPRQVGAEVEQHGGHRPELGDGGERRAGVLPAGEGGNDAQVRGARDRQELGQPLRDPEDDRLEDRQGGGTLVGLRRRLF